MLLECQEWSRAREKSRTSVWKGKQNFDGQSDADWRKELPAGVRAAWRERTESRRNCYNFHIDDRDFILALDLSRRRNPNTLPIRGEGEISATADRSASPLLPSATVLHMFLAVLLCILSTYCGHCQPFLLLLDIPIPLCRLLSPDFYSLFCITSSFVFTLDSPYKWHSLISWFHCKLTQSSDSKCLFLNLHFVTHMCMCACVCR